MIQVTDDRMTLMTGHAITATACKQPGGRWQVTGYPALLDRNQAITALTVIELIHACHHDNDPIVTALRNELPPGSQCLHERTDLK